MWLFAKFAVDDSGPPRFGDYPAPRVPIFAPQARAVPKPAVLIECVNAASSWRARRETPTRRPPPPAARLLVRRLLPAESAMLSGCKRIPGTVSLGFEKLPSESCTAALAL